MMSYAEALAWLESFTNTERSGAFLWEGETSLIRERALLARLGNPERSYGMTHVAGTKGKGSTSALIAAILQAAGIYTGLYTQPELHTLRERIRAGLQLISEEEMAGLLSQVREALTGVDASLGPFITYELVTALALLFFREAGARHVVIEVGLGGRLDATNVIEPLVSVITSLSYDHMQVLGNTLTEIAGEKAGIIKPGVPVVSSAQAPEAVAVIKRRCQEQGALLLRVGPEHTPDCQYTYRDEGADSERQWFSITTPTNTYRNLELSLLGAHQLENAAAAAAVAETLRAQGLPVDERAIRQGLREARWPGRLQVVQRQPLLVVDGAHNADSFARLFAALRRHFAFECLLLVLGTMADKDINGIAAEIVHAGVSRVVVTGAAHPRAAAPDALAATLARAGQREITSCADVSAALRLALCEASARDLVCVAGSIYLAGEALRWAEKEQASQIS